nr:thioredoxin-like fold motif-containing [Pandoravirus massiliensis]
MQRTTTTRIYNPRGTGLCGLGAAAPVVVAAPPALSRAQSAAAAAATDAVVVTGAHGHHHHHHADVPVRKDCGFPWWVLLLLALAVIIVGVWLWLRGKRDGNGVRAVIVAPGAPQQPPGSPVAPPMSPVMPPASPPIAGGGGVLRPGSPVPGSPVYSPLMIQTPAAAPMAPAGQVARPYGLVPVGTATKVTGDQVKADVEAGNPALVMYTMDGCHHCDQALPEIQKAAANLGMPVLVVDREDTAPSDRPVGYPSIYAIAGPNDTRLFSGERTADAFLRFVAQHLGSHWVRPGCGMGF